VAIEIITSSSENKNKVIGLELNVLKTLCAFAQMYLQRY
jgi:hypothetical protein